MKKLNKRKYTKRNPTALQELHLLEEKYKNDLEKFQYLEKQNHYLNENINRNDSEIAELREKNANLMEAIIILARKSRVEAQEKRLSREYQVAEATPRNECEAGYTHGYR